MDLLKVMQQRRSIRKYTQEKIPKESLEKILQAGLLSPSGKNIKPWEFLVLQEKENLDFLSKARMGSSSAMLEGAACAIVVLADSTKTDVWIEDASIAMTNMHLMASYLGIGSCWIQGRERMATETLSTEEALRRKFCFPDSYKLQAILSLGMPASSLAEHKLEDLNFSKIHWEKF